MTDLSLPATIDGLVRSCSPVLVRLPGGGDVCIHGVVVLPGYIAFRDGGVSDIWEYGLPNERGIVAAPFDVDIADVALDLSSATGRAHAAWWVEAASAAIYGESYRMHPEALRAMRLAASGAEMPDAQVATLRDLCLYVAGMGQPS